MWTENLQMSMSGDVDPSAISLQFRVDTARLERTKERNIVLWKKL